MALSMRGRNRRQTAREYVERRLAFHDYDDLADILKGATHQLAWAPSRSTFYAWVKAWRDERARDQSGPWSLAADETGRPDIVMTLIAALVNRTGGRVIELTVAEATWTTRLATALPDILKDATWAGTEERAEFGVLEAWRWALRFIAAQTAGDEEQMRWLESMTAMAYATPLGMPTGDPSAELLTQAKAEEED